MNDCKGKAGEWFGHNFQHQYDRKERDRATSVDHMQGRELILKYLEPLVDTTYVQSVCSRCGPIIGRQS